MIHAMLTAYVAIKQTICPYGVRAYLLTIPLHPSPMPSHSKYGSLRAAVACYPSELTVPLLLQPFPSPAGHPPPLNTPPMGKGFSLPVGSGNR